MKNSRRTFFKQGLAGALALGSASLPIPAAAMTDGVGKAKAKRVVLISLDGICVEGFLKARTPNLVPCWLMVPFRLIRRWLCLR